jgi:hypothetical protein
VVSIIFIVTLSLVAIGLAVIPAHAGSSAKARRLGHDSQRFEEDLRSNRDHLS